MKNFLSVSIDDDGRMTIDSDFQLFDLSEPQMLKEYDSLVKEAIRELTECLWRDKKVNVSAAIRLLSMAETAAVDEPYISVEEFWNTMMFGFLPFYEAYFTSVKKPYGIDQSGLTRPVVTEGDGISPMTSIFTPNSIKS